MIEDVIDLDLSTPKRIHIVGIGGAGMNPIARVLHAMGHKVSGSDATQSAMLEKLQAMGIAASVGHLGANISDAVDVVAISTAVAATNPEVVAAREKMKLVVSRAVVLRAIAKTRHPVAVVGTHGKTTTSSLSAAAFLGGGLEPSWIIGGDIGGKGGAHWGASPWLILEADESDGTFLTLDAKSAIVTNIEPDHLDHYGSWAALQQSFVKFVEAVPGQVFACIDDEGVANLLNAESLQTYGTSPNAKWRIENVGVQDFGTSFELVHATKRYRLSVPLPGVHNARNAAAAFGLAVTLGADPVGAAKGIAEFSGVGRRFQRRGEAGGVVFVDDYAHLPTEVEAAIQAAKAGSWNRVVAVFQPHRYSRTEQVGNDFAHSFDAADVVVLTDVYSAGEEPRKGIDGTMVRDAVVRTGKPVIYVEERAQLAERVNEILKPGDLCLSLGAGDITRLADEVLGVR